MEKKLLMLELSEREVILLRSTISRCKNANDEDINVFTDWKAEAIHDGDLETLSKLRNSANILAGHNAFYRRIMTALDEL